MNIVKRKERKKRMVVVTLFKNQTHTILVLENRGNDLPPRIKLLTKRNDPWMVNHSKIFIMICRANTDMQIVLDKWACRKYLAKYAAKAEKRTEKINEYISNLVRQFDNEQSAVKLYRKIMMKLITGRDICHQEACHF